MNVLANIPAETSLPALVRTGIDGPFVYFIRSGLGGPVKIGVSRDPKRRLRQLQTGSAEPLTLAAVIPGGYAAEAIIHNHLAGDRIHGEHFVATPRVLDFIAALLRAHADALEAKWQSRQTGAAA